MRHPSGGNGDPCPIDETHGRMWMLASGRQWCAHSAHSAVDDPALFENDGVTRATTAQEPRGATRTAAAAAGASQGR